MLLMEPADTVPALLLTVVLLIVPEPLLLSSAALIVPELVLVPTVTFEVVPAP
jgi:hypothetical protein